MRLSIKDIKSNKKVTPTSGKANISANDINRLHQVFNPMPVEKFTPKPTIAPANSTIAKPFINSTVERLQQQPSNQITMETLMKNQLSTPKAGLSKWETPSRTRVNNNAINVNMASPEQVPLNVLDTGGNLVRTTLKTFNKLNNPLLGVDKENILTDNQKKGMALLEQIKQQPQQSMLSRPEGIKPTYGLPENIPTSRMILPKNDINWKEFKVDSSGNLVPDISVKQNIITTDKYEKPLSELANIPLSLNPLRTSSTTASEAMQGFNEEAKTTQDVLGELMLYLMTDPTTFIGGGAVAGGKQTVANILGKMPLKSAKALGQTLNKTKVVGKFLNGAEDISELSGDIINALQKEVPIDDIVKATGKSKTEIQSLIENRVSDILERQNANKLLENTIPKDPIKKTYTLNKPSSSIYTSKPVSSQAYYQTLKNEISNNGLKPTADKYGYKNISDMLSDVENKISKQNAIPITKLDTPQSPAMPLSPQDNTNILNDNKMAQNVTKIVTEGNVKNAIKNTPIKEYVSQKVNNAQKYMAEGNKVKAELEIKSIVDDLVQENKIDQIEEVRKWLPVNLQFFASDDVVEQVISKFRTNTIERSKIISDKTREMFPEESASYTPEKAKEWLDDAEWNIKKDRNGTEQKILDTDGALSKVQQNEAAILAEGYEKQIKETGIVPNEYLKLLNKVTESNREAGRGLKAIDTAWEKNDATSAIVEANKVVKKSHENVSPKTKKKIETETKNTRDAIDQAEKETVEKLNKELPEEILARKVSSTLNDTTKTNPLTDMVNELYKLAKESPLAKDLKPPRNPIEFLKQAIQNKGVYADVWDKAKVIVKEKFKDDPEALSILDDYFNKGSIPTYSDATLNASVKKSMGDIGQKVSDIVRQSKGDKEKALQGLTDHITTNTGAVGEDAKLLAEKIAKRYNELLKEKTTQIVTNMSKNTPKKARTTMIQKIMELINLGVYDDEALKNIIRQKEGLPILESSDVKNIINWTEKAKQFPEGSYENRMWKSRINDVIANKYPVTLREKFKALQRVSLLSGLKSLVARNPLGNTILAGAENIKDVPGAFIDMATSKILKTERTTALNPLPKLKGQAEGFRTGLKEFGLDIKNKVDTSPTGGQLEIERGKRIFKNNFLNAIDQFERKALQLGDRPFYESALQGRIAELKGLGRTIDEQTLAEAKLYALDKVFQGDTLLAKKAKMIKEGLGIFGDIVIPFTQTPSNILDKLIDYTPAGFGKGLFHLGEGMKKGTFNQKLFVDRLARSLTGTGIGILGYVLASKGLSTGKQDTRRKIEKYEQSLGKQQYSFKIGDKYYSFDWAQPIGGLLSAGADAFYAGKDKKDALSALGAGAEAVGNTMLNQSFLQGVLKMMSGYSPAAGILQTGIESPTQFAPTVGSNIARLIDPYVRDTKDDNLVKQTANKYINKIPFASTLLPKKTDLWGKDIKYQQDNGTLEKTFNIFFNPSNVSKYKPTDLDKELVRVYKEVGDTEILPKEPNDSIDYKKEKIVLNKNEKEKWKKTAGKEALNSLTILFKSDLYKKANDENKSKMIKKKFDNANKLAKEELLKSRGK